MSSIAVDDAVTVVQARLLNINMAANDTPSSRTSGVSWAIATSPSHGNLFGVNALDGTVQYISDDGFVGTDSFTYTLTDTNPDPVVISTATVVITVTQDIPLQAVDDNFTVNGPLSASVATNDIPGSNAASPIWNVITSPMHGTIDPWPGDGTFTYTPDVGYSGSDSFVYEMDDYPSSQASQATVNLTVTSSTRPSIKAWYKGRQVYLGLITNALVFNGFEFVRPQDAEFVMIVETVTVGPKTVPPPWPETQTLDQASLTWTNFWLCQVIALEQPPISDIDIIAVNDPNNGACVCGVSCLGTQLQYVQVTVTPDA